MPLYAYLTPKVDFKRKFNHHQSFLYDWQRGRFENFESDHHYESNLESDVRFEIESNHEASQVPTEVDNVGWKIKPYVAYLQWKLNNEIRFRHAGVYVESIFRTHMNAFCKHYNRNIHHCVALFGFNRLFSKYCTVKFSQRSTTKVMNYGKMNIAWAEAGLTSKNERQSERHCQKTDCYRNGGAEIARPDIARLDNAAPD